ncbi:unnamed protein product [Pleuronectes platessa]|uniref:Uncharacterized protein n=1 Tax=Pleuronectes platessa TaxID=8262 RepID=A0A9N7VV71_PLEPL|nr:unnamed protein product [Pleuronectes platessa]
MHGHSHLQGQLISPSSPFSRTKLTPGFPLLNCRDLYSPTLEFWRFRFGMSELGVSRLFGPGCGPERGLGTPKQNVFIDGRKQSGRQHRLAVIGRRVSGVFEIPYVSEVFSGLESTHCCLLSLQLRELLDFSQLAWSDHAGTSGRAER